MNRLCALAAVAATLAVAGCDGFPGNKKAQPAPSGAAAVAAVPSESDIRAELTSQNFGRAAALATTAVAADPGNAQLHFLRARAEGYLGDAGQAVVSLEKAVLAGLADRKAAFADAAFDGIRHEAVFEDAQRRLLPQQAQLGRQGARARSRTVAGDVEISERGGHQHIRAGDVVLDTND